MMPEVEIMYLALNIASSQAAELSIPLCAFIGIIL